MSQKVSVFSNRWTCGILCLTLAVLLLTGNGKVDASDSLHCLDPEALWIEQGPFIIKSLKRIYHGGYRSPQGIRNTLCMNQQQYQRAQQRYASLSEHEKDVLGRRYCVIENEATDNETWYCEEELMLWALRDSDGDGILDFRVKEFGSFIQNDPDADNDGIENLMDSRPLGGNASLDQVSRHDRDRDGLPDHLDWSNSGWHPSFKAKSQHLQDTQKEIFDSFGIVMIESEGSEISEPFADMTLDVLQIFRRLYNKHDAGQFTRSITLTDQYDYDPYGVLAEVSPVNGQILLFEYGIQEVVKDPNNLIAPFMVYIHEFAHVIQNAMDYPDNSADLLKFNAHTAPTRFAESVERMGWSFPQDQLPQLTLVDGFVDHGSEPVGFAEIYRQISLDTLKKICETRWNETSLAQWQKFNVVMCYSLDSVREWHAEYIATTVLREMYRYVADTFPRHADAMVQHAQMKMYHDWNGESYDHNNADRRIVRQISRQLRMAKRLIRKIANKYVVDPYLHSFDLSRADIIEIQPISER